MTPHHLALQIPFIVFGFNIQLLCLGFFCLFVCCFLFMGRGFREIEKLRHFCVYPEFLGKERNPGQLGDRISPFVPTAGPTVRERGPRQHSRHLMAGVPLRASYVPLEGSRYCLKWADTS